MSSIESVGCQLPHRIELGLDGSAGFDDGEAEVGILANRVARPVAARLQRLAVDQAHRPVHDDAIGLVAIDHADVEEAGIFAVHGVVHQRAVAVAMLLRRLHQADARIGENRAMPRRMSALSNVVSAVNRPVRNPRPSGL